jgi:hypothetical protein
MSNAGFPRACNAAQPSPSGRYIAVLVDGCTGLVVLRKDQGFRYDGSAAWNPADPSSGQPHLKLVNVHNPHERPPWSKALPVDEAGVVYGAASSLLCTARHGHIPFSLPPRRTKLPSPAQLLSRGKAVWSFSGLCARLEPLPKLDCS